MSGQGIEGGAGGRRELLVILSGDQAEEGFRKLSSDYKVHHVVSNRVVVVEGAQSDLAGLRAIPGVIAATAGDLSPGVLNGLDDSESLFVAAWLSRIKEGAPKQRSGEGLNWDAPGFEPPDPPAGNS
ncbi:MAG TPA: hypothetical protein VF553_09795 [Pyrinomonadaceae bacterium]|jgi:hypothetical protein